MDHFYDNSLQTGLMRDMAMDLEMGEHLVLLGNQVGTTWYPWSGRSTRNLAQGVGKNKIIDRSVRALCNLTGDWLIFIEQAVPGIAAL